MSARRRRGGDEFADDQPWLAEDDDTGPWPADDDAGPWPPVDDEDGWPDRPGQASGGGRRGRHSAAADPGAAAAPPGWEEPGWDDPEQEDRYALRREPDPPPARRAAPWEQDRPARDRYPAGPARNGMAGDRYTEPPGRGQGPDPRPAGRGTRRAPAPGNARPAGYPDAGYPDTGYPDTGYPDTGDRYAGPSGPDADPLRRPSSPGGRTGRGGDPAAPYGAPASRGDRPAGYSDPGGRYRDPGGQYRHQDDWDRGTAGRNGSPGGRDADPGGRYRDLDVPYGDPGGRGRDPGAEYHDPAGRPGDRGPGHDDSPGRRAAARSRYAGAGDDYPPPDRGVGRRPDAHARRAGPGDDDYRDEYGERPARDRAGGSRGPVPGDQPARGGRAPRDGARRSGPAGSGYGGQGRGQAGYGTGRDAGDRAAAGGRAADPEDLDWDDDSYQDRDDEGYHDRDWPFGQDAGGSGDGNDRRKPKRKRRGRWAGPSSLLVVAAIILIPLIIGGVYAYRVISSHYNPPNYSGDGTGQVIFQVKPGDTSLTVGDRLVTAGVVASSRALVLAAEHSSNSSELQPGYYRLHKHMSAQAAWNLLLTPSAREQLKVTIPEGWRVPQILAALSKQSGISASDFNKALKDTSALGLPSYAKGNPEGYLFPDTYEIQPHSSASSVLKTMVSTFNQQAASINLPKQAAHGNLTPAEAIVVASLAQAEGGKDSDFPKITRVIYNRLQAHMRLDLDSTVLYALHTYGILASDQQLKVKSPYNTYAHEGLPPAPIDSPGLAAIQAALHPAKGNWLYFVTVNPKTKQTDFTSSPAVFQQYKNQLQQYLSSHGG